jgi:hypothetical protein
MRACARASVPFKATAGLHHALCGRYPLTYEAGSDRAEMFGFLNVSVAAALVHAGATSAEAIDALKESSPRAFTFTGAALEWRERSISTTALEDMRRNFFRSFGSCSFDEPMKELEQLALV